VAATFDTTRDWAGEYAQATGRAYHAETHFVQYYSELLIGDLGRVQPCPPLPPAAWCDVKTADGRSAFRTLFVCVRSLSQLRATAASILAAERDEQRLRQGVKILTEDPEE
jgi:hypothetical protein